jgi:hypothetical protein
VFQSPPFLLSTALLNHVGKCCCRLDQRLASDRDVDLMDGRRVVADKRLGDDLRDSRLVQERGRCAP